MIYVDNENRTSIPTLALAKSLIQYLKRPNDTGLVMVKLYSKLYIFYYYSQSTS